MDGTFQALIDRLDHLSAQFDDLRRLIRKAVRLADDDPEMALTRIRKVLEYVVHDAFERLVKEPPGTRPLENLLQRLVKDGHLPLHLAPHATFIRELGNAGTHRGEGHYKMSDVNVALIHLGAILDWYFELVRPDAAFAPASPDPSPDLDGPPRPVAPPAPLPERRRPRWPMIVAAALLGVLLLGAFIYVQTDKGRIGLVGNDPTPKSEAPTEVKKPEAAPKPDMERDSAAPPDLATKVIEKAKEASPPAPPAPGPATGPASSTVPPKPIAKSVGLTVPPREITNSISMKLVLIPSGEFLMGSDGTDPDAEDDEVVVDAAGKKQKHRVRITRPFYLGTTEVTRGQFRRFVDEAGYQTEAEKDGKGGSGWNEEKKTFEQDPRYTWQNPGFEQTDEHSVVNVSWNDAVAFAAWLSRKEGTTYRLPTEAEWEYACRAGTTSRYSSGDDPEGLAAVGNIADGTLKAKYPDWKYTTVAARDGFVYTAPVGRYNANAWGLFDMHGNVWEWCSDGYAADYYKGSPVDDPPGPDGAAYRVIRGGGWSVEPRYARSAYRNGSAPVARRDDLGFRLARVQSVR